MSGSSRRIRVAGSRQVRVSAVRDTGPKLPRTVRKRRKIDRLIAFVHEQGALLKRFADNDPSLNNDDLRRLYHMVTISSRRHHHDSCALLNNIERAELVLFLNRMRSDPTGFAKNEIERFRSLAERYLTGDMKLLNEIDALPVKE